MIDLRPSRARFLRGAAATTVALGAGALPMPSLAYDLVIVGKDRWLFPGWSSLTDAPMDSVQTSLGLVAQARDLFATKGIQLLFIAVPMKARFYEKEFNPGTTMSEAVRTRYARILEMTAAAKLLTVDLNAAILPIGQVRDQTIFYQTDQHWTSWSAEAAAAAVAATIQRNLKLPAASGHGDALGNWITEQHLGDLTSLLPKEQQAQIGLQTYVQRQPSDSDIKLQNSLGNSLLVPELSVRVVGSSFARPDFGFPQKLSNTLNRPVGLTWLRGDTGPWKIMLNYVESNDFKTKPSVIVWQFNEPDMIYGPTAPGFWFEGSQLTTDQWLTRMQAAVNALR